MAVKREWVRLCLVILAITIPLSALTGAFLGMYGKKLGLTAPWRTGLMLGFVIAIAQFTSFYVRRRMSARDGD